MSTQYVVHHLELFHHIYAYRLWSLSSSGDAIFKYKGHGPTVTSKSAPKNLTHRFLPTLNYPPNFSTSNHSSWNFIGSIELIVKGNGSWL